MNGEGVDGDWRKHKNNLSYIQEPIPAKVKQSCIEITKSLGLVFGGIDLAFRDGVFYFIEINPTGEWAWLRKKAEARIDLSICDYLCGERD